MARRDGTRRLSPLVPAALFVVTFAAVLCPPELRPRALGALCVAAVVTAAACLMYRILESSVETSPSPTPVAEQAPVEAPAETAPAQQGDARAQAPLEPEPEPESEPEAAEKVAKPVDPLPDPAPEPTPDLATIPTAKDAEVAQGVADLDTLLALIQSGGLAQRLDEGFDPQALVESLEESPDVFGALRMFVGAVRTAEAEGGGGTCPASRALARWLVEAGLLASEVELPSVTCVLLDRTGLAYLRINATRLTYLAKVRTLAIESALNRMLLVSRSLVDVATASEEEVWRADAAVVAGIARRLSHEQLEGSGEWDARHNVSLALETWPLPLRLVTSFRTNLAEGVAAAEVQLPPPEAFPRSRWSEALGRVIPNSRQMRMRTASEFAARACLMVAASMLLGSEGIGRVWVAGVSDNGMRHICHVSLELSRDKLPLVVWDERPEIPNPIWTLSVLGARMDPWNGALRPVRQGFSLDDERFCPRTRYEEVGLSTRTLGETDARALNAQNVSDLEIDEEARREHVAADIVRGLSGSVESDVRLILSSAAADPDPSVREAAMRTVGKLIDGTLADEGPLGIRDEFVDGDELTDALRSAVESFRRQDVESVAKTLSAALELVDAMGTYEDTPAHEYRCFRSYVERALYNRLFATEGRRVLLASGAYHAAQIMLSDALAALDDVDGSLRHARRALELDPLDERARLRVSRALEVKGDVLGAAAQIAEMLRVAYQPEVIAMAYLRLSQIAWHAGDFLAADACLRTCLHWAGGTPLEQIAGFAIAMSNSVGSLLEDASTEQIEQVLEARDIPVAPTPEVREALEQCARATVDAEVFPAARDLAQALGKLTADDVIWGIARSIEHEPDR